MADGPLADQCKEKLIVLMSKVSSPFAGGTNNSPFLNFVSTIEVNQSLVPVLMSNFQCLGSEPNLLDSVCRFGLSKRQTQNPCSNPTAAVTCIGMFMYRNMHS